MLIVACLAKLALVRRVKLEGWSARLALRSGDVVHIINPVKLQCLILKYSASGFDPAGGAFVGGGEEQHQAVASASTVCSVLRTGGGSRVATSSF